MLVPLPGPVGLVCIGKLYLLLTSLCFVAMGSGIDLADGPDGLAGGTAALAFVGMSIAVLPICSGKHVPVILFLLGWVHAMVMAHNFHHGMFAFECWHPHNVFTLYLWSLADSSLCFFS